MKDPRRLIEAGEDDFETRVLLASRGRQPSADGLKRTMAAMGIGAATAVSAAGAAASAKAAGATAVTGAKALMVGAGWQSVLAWTAIGAVVGGLTITGVHLSDSSQSDRKTIGPATSPSAHVALPGPARGFPQLTPESSPAVSLTVPEVLGRPAAGEEPHPSSGRVLPAPAVERETSPIVQPVASAAAVDSADGVHRTSQLSDEVVALDQARKAVQRRQGAAALQAIENYHRTFPRGGLADEATVLRVQAMILSGDRQGGLSVARSFLASHPDSPHSARLRQWLPELSNP